MPGSATSRSRSEARLTRYQRLRRSEFRISNMVKQTMMSTRSEPGATSGVVFTARAFRNYSNAHKRAVEHPTPKMKTGFDVRCSHWAVTTTIFQVSKAISQILALHNWCLVVVGDRKTPTNFALNGTSAFYLSPNAQERLPYKITSHIRWNHFGRKNIGYLFAIHHGAKFIYDFDDDNELLHDKIPTKFHQTSIYWVRTPKIMYELTFGRFFTRSFAR